MEFGNELGIVTVAGKRGDNDSRDERDDLCHHRRGELCTVHSEDTMTMATEEIWTKLACGRGGASMGGASERSCNNMRESQQKEQPNSAGRAKILQLF